MFDVDGGHVFVYQGKPSRILTVERWYEHPSLESGSASLEGGIHLDNPSIANHVKMAAARGFLVGDAPPVQFPVDSNFYDHWSYCLSDPSPSLDEAISPPFSPGLLATVSIRRWYIKASFPSEDILVPTDLPKSILTVVGPSAESVGAFSKLVRSFSGEVASVG